MFWLGYGYLADVRVRYLLERALRGLCNHCTSSVTSSPETQWNSAVSRVALDVRSIPLLGLDFLDPVLEIVRFKVDALHAGYEEGRFGEEVLHLLERALGRLGQHSPEEERVGEVANLYIRISSGTHTQR